MNSKASSMELGADAQQPAPALTPAQRKTLALSSLGTLLEFYEFTLFGFFTAIISQEFFPPHMPQWARELQTFAIFSLGYFIRPLSGTIIGHLGDKFGRKKLFMFTLFMMAMPTTLMAFLPTYAQIGVAAPILLLVLRLMQGLAVAGETAGSSVFVAEHVDGRRLGYAMGWLFCGTYLGYFLGAAVSALLANTMAAETLQSIGWRVPFLIGGIFGFVAVYLRRYLEETPVFESIRQTKAHAQAFPFGEVMRSHKPAVLYVIGLAAYLGIMITAIFFYMPTFLQTQYKLPRTEVFTATAASLAILAAMCPLWGRVADRIGFGKVLGGGAVVTAVLVVIFFRHIDGVLQAPGTLIYWYAGFAVFASAVTVLPALASMVFPPHVRFTGFALGYNVGAALFAGTTPIALTWITTTYGREAVPAYLVLAGAIGLVLGLLAPRMPRHVRLSRA